ncbi:MAG: bifunctional UDP-N-acetylglucosamine diphosphorylase/glucosamine-1-phosphate N-acetyltransferase GlmU [Tepidiphilus sp.]|nr:bifunctional UDP-N-acetylglucosamine diphosphorylase/glucosamine-1-phosphate N-acetyltransferase GlmU [Tepidiphilus sp.]MDD3434250.1 bifunctional UDP-N-acetylglucosamine diphosphorylase/glucosamine-1-phosphate N-acetyltransferase GlmU [Tepidiphilus sp.]
MEVVILAAGKGTRMRSRLPKVLQPLAGRPLLAHVLDTARALNPQRTVVVIGHEAQQVREAFAAQGDLVWVEQHPQLGTGHALRTALPFLGREDVVLVLYGDVPLLRPQTLARLLEAAEGGKALAILTARLPDPRGYGRIVRDAGGRIRAIVEEKDADANVRAITEINTGVMALPAARLPAWLEALTNANAQGEYYLTDVVAAAVRDGVPVIGVEAEDATEVTGVNDKAQLAALERLYQRREAERLLRAGVTLLDPARLEVRGTLECGLDVTIDVGCVFSGRVVLGDGVRVGPYCVLSDCTVGDGAEIRAFSHLEGAEIGPQAVVGPYARLRPGTVLAHGVHIGNFVEVKNSSLGPETKANHLAYLGDAEIGARVNIGAGTITCNYDGANKHRTVIEDEAFIGSDTQLVAPVRVGRGATLGAGTTLTRDAPPEALTVSRAPQRTLSGWQRPTKKKE